MDFDTYKIPGYMRDSITQWVKNGIEPGDFLHAVLTNNLVGAVARADNTNINLLPNYIRFFNNETPMDCWGSVDLYLAWAKKGGIKK